MIKSTMQWSMTAHSVPCKSNFAKRPFPDIQTGAVFCSSWTACSPVRWTPPQWPIGTVSERSGDRATRPSDLATERVSVQRSTRASPSPEVISSPQIHWLSPSYHPAHPRGFARGNSNPGPPGLKFAEHEPCGTWSIHFSLWPNFPILVRGNEAYILYRWNEGHWKDGGARI